jgi:hypothetical protein
LHPDDRFGVLKPLTQSGVFTTKLAEIGVRGLGDHGLGAASERLERFERTTIALAAPLGQGGRVKASRRRMAAIPPVSAARSVSYAQA